MNQAIKDTFEKLIALIPRVGQWRQAFLRHSYPGHYYSPIPDLEEVSKRESKIFSKDKNFYGIDFNDHLQLELLEKVKPFLPEAPWTSHPQPGLSFCLDNIYYTGSDALALYGLMRLLKPHRIIEVGSGWSSALMLDTNRLFFNERIQLLFIEPFPDRLSRLMRKEDRAEHRREFIQDVDLNIFRQLQDGDFLFIDTSHVSKVGSDVNHILFEILPVLQSGVYVHFHDVHYPFEYPRKWIYKGYAWNETYLLRAYLTKNPDYEIVFMNTYLEHKYPDKMPETFFVNNDPEMITGSIWLRRK